MERNKGKKTKLGRNEGKKTKLNMERNEVKKTKLEMLLGKTSLHLSHLNK